jgi:hypothetical protein
MVEISEQEQARSLKAKASYVGAAIKFEDAGASLGVPTQSVGTMKQTCQVFKT